MQRQYNIGLNSHPGTISYAVDKRSYQRLKSKDAENAWNEPGAGDKLRPPRRTILPRGNELVSPKMRKSSNVHLKTVRKSRQLVNFLPPQYSPGYTKDVSHLVV